ncbi:MAG: class I SAM-dependent methyltransferase [Cyanobacteriota bacterium]
MISDEEKYWSNFAANYDKDVLFMFGEKIHDEVRKKLNIESDLNKTVEFGCGTGIYTREIAKNATEIYATDLSEEMIKVAKVQLKDLENVQIQKEDCQQTSFIDNTFDSIIMTNVFMLLPEPQRSIEENSRILKEGGKLIIICYTIAGLSLFGIIRVLFRIIKTTKKPPQNIKLYTPAKLTQYIEKFNFTVQEATLLKGNMNAVYLKAFKNS